MNATLFLVAANVAVFLAQNFFPEWTNAFLPLTPSEVTGAGMYWQFLTYMFTHGSYTHIIFNMIGLYLFGVQVERRVGSTEFLLFYFFCGILAGIFSFFAYSLLGWENIHLMGASGAIFAVLLAFAAFFPDQKIFLMGLLPVRAPILVIGYAVIEIGSQLFSLQNGVAHLTHLAGFGFAWIYFLVRYGINPWKRFFLK
jgi:membrane associated rhomboid family serine protease